MFNWLSRRIIARLPSRRGAAAMTDVSARGLHFRPPNGQEQTIRWDSIERVVAIASAELVGETAMLVIGLIGGGTATVTAIAPGWGQLIADLPRFLPGARPADLWRLEMLDGKPVEVYRRSRNSPNPDARE